MYNTDEVIKPTDYGAQNPDKTPVKLCHVCGFIYEASKMVKYQGNYYCRPNECYKDINGLRARNKVKRSKR